MLALDRTSRVALACAGLIAFAGAFSTAPTTAHGEPVPTVIATATVPASTPTRFVVIEPRRDPFAGGMPPAVEPAPRTAVTQPPFPAIAPVLGPLPPNAGAGGGAFPFPAAEHVSAIVTGAHPFALIDDGSTTRLITIGDRCGGQRIVTIDPDGVHLEDGTTLPVTERPSFQQPNPEADSREMLDRRGPGPDRRRLPGRRA
jgi:hypothetical protein